MCLVIPHPTFQPDWDDPSETAVAKHLKTPKSPDLKETRVPGKLKKTTNHDIAHPFIGVKSSHGGITDVKHTQ